MSCGHRGAAGGATLQPVTRSRPWTGFARRNGVPGCEGSLPSRGREPSRRILLRILPAPGACGRPQLQLRTLAASRWSPRGARHLSPHTLRRATRSPSQAAPPTVSRAGRPRPAHTRCPWCAAVPNWPVPSARSPVPSVQCPVPSAQCRVPSAVCPDHAQCRVCPKAPMPIVPQCPRCPIAPWCSVVRGRTSGRLSTPTSARRPMCATAERGRLPWPASRLKSRLLYV